MTVSGRRPVVIEFPKTTAPHGVPDLPTIGEETEAAALRRSARFGEGETLWVFEHATRTQAAIYLPQMDPDQAVDSMHLAGVRATLKAHGIASDNLEQLFLAS